MNAIDFRFSKVGDIKMHNINISLPTLGESDQGGAGASIHESELIVIPIPIPLELSGHRNFLLSKISFQKSVTPPPLSGQATKKNNFFCGFPNSTHLIWHSIIHLSFIRLLAYSFCLGNAQREPEGVEWQAHRLCG